EQRPGQPEAVEEGDREHRGQELDERVARRDAHAAGAAPAAEEEVGDDGDVVVGPDGRVAGRAARRRADDRPPRRDPHDADVEERPPERSEDERERVEERGRHPEDVGQADFFSITKIGRSRLATTSSLMTTSRTSAMEGSSYMMSRSVSSMIARRPRAPLLRPFASWAMAAIASSV